MTALTPQQVEADLVAAGMPVGAAVTMTAIAGAESQWKDDALGDTTLENSTWGPSYGLFQIRTLKRDTGTGSDRDIAALAGNDMRQARSAVDISQGGRDFSPWSTYTSGAFQNYLGQARAAANLGGLVGSAAGAAVGNPAGGVGVGTGVTATPAGFGPNWLPWNWGSALSGTASGILGGVRNIALEAAFAALGLGLVYAGAIVMVRPAAKSKERQLRGAVAEVV